MSRRPFMKHNPAFLSTEDLVASFVVRKPDLDLLIETVRENSRAAANQHLLVIGARGQGKTTLVLRAVAAINVDAELNQHWSPIVFGEESYSVATAGEFWLEALLHLADQTGAERWREAYLRLRSERDEQRLRESALARLLDFADEAGKRLLLVVENLNMLLGEQLDADAGWTLRHTLLNEPRIMLLATATSRFDAIDSAKHAMFELFSIHELRSLDLEDCRRLWAAVTGGTLSAFQVRPIQILTGGNPRLLAILASFAADTSLHTLMHDLTELIDDHTTYFKSNLDALPALERKVYVTLADIWAPATAREVADAARLDVNRTSALLHRLVGRGAVEPVGKDGRKANYQLTERLYNLYHLMRRRGGEESRARMAVEFMAAFYEPGALVDLTRVISEEACRLDPSLRREHFLTIEGLLHHTRTREVRDGLLSAIDPKFLRLEDAPSSFKRSVKQRRLATADQEERALRVKLAKDPADASSWFLLGGLLKNRPERHRDAIAAFRKVTRLQRSGDMAMYAHLGLGNMLSGEKSIAAFHAARRANPNHWLPFLLLGQASVINRRFEEAEAPLRHALSIAPDEFLTRRGWAIYLSCRPGREVEAETACRKIIELRSDDALSWCGLAVVLNRLGRTTEAIDAQRRMTALVPDNADAWRQLGALLVEHQAFDEARQALRRACELQLDDWESWFYLGLLARRFGAEEELQQADLRVEQVLDKRPGIRSFTPLESLAVAMVFGRRARWTEALTALTAIVAQVSPLTDHRQLVTEIIVEAAAAGHADKALRLLRDSPVVAKFEPLVLALEMLTGVAKNAPLEVAEVAKDIVARIEGRRARLQGGTAST